MAGNIDFGLLDARAPERIANSFYEGQQQQQKNALMQAQLQTAQRTNKLADLAMAQEESAGQAFQAAGGDQAKLQEEYQRRGLYKQYQELQKQQLEAQAKQATIAKDKSTAGKNDYELATQKRDRAMSEVIALPSAWHAIASIDAKVAAGEIAADVAEALKRTIPADGNPQSFSDWKNKTLTAMMKPKEQVDARQKAEELDYRKKHDTETLGETRRHHGVTEAQGRASLVQSGRQHRETLASKTTPQGKPMPVGALKLQQEELDAIGIGSSINADLDAVEKQIGSGKLSLGLVSNVAGKAMNYVGASTENSRNLATFQATLEKLRNDSLRLNKGVQTEGDAMRAWDEILSNINDGPLVKKRLGEIRKINERAVNLRKMNVDNIRRNYGAADLDTAGYENQQPAIGGQATAYDDAGKEARYQAWKKAQGK